MDEEKLKEFYRKEFEKMPEKIKEYYGSGQAEKDMEEVCKKLSIDKKYVPDLSALFVGRLFRQEELNTLNRDLVSIITDKKERLKIIKEMLDLMEPFSEEMREIRQRQKEDGSIDFVREMEEEAEKEFQQLIEEAKEHAHKLKEENKGSKQVAPAPPPKPNDPPPPTKGPSVDNENNDTRTEPSTPTPTENEQNQEEDEERANILRAIEDPSYETTDKETLKNFPNEQNNG